MSIDIPKRKKQSWQIFDQIAPTYDRINKIISFGIDIYWRKQFRKHLPDRARLVCLDLATGTADVALELAKDDRVSRVLGTDLSQEMIEYGKLKVENSEYKSKLTLKVGDGVKIPEKASQFDIVTVSFGIRNFPNYELALKNMRRVLRPRGRVLILEFSLPRFSVVRIPYLLYFRQILPRIGNLLSGHKDAYTYLNRTVEDFPFGRDFMDAMVRAGFVNVRQKRMTFGVATLYIGEK